MSYVNKSIIKDEEILEKANMTNWIYLNEFIFLFMILFYYLYLNLFLRISVIKASMGVLPFILIWGFIFVREIIRDLSTELAVTNRRILGKKGFIRIKTLDTPIENVDNIQIKCSFIGRILRYGTIVIESKSDSHEFSKIANPFKLKKKIASKSEFLKKN